VGVTEDVGFTAVDTVVEAALREDVKIAWSAIAAVGVAAALVMEMELAVEQHLGPEEPVNHIGGVQGDQEVRVGQGEADKVGWVTGQDREVPVMDKLLRTGTAACAGLACLWALWA
jgi:hypothetical protein